MIAHGFIGFDTDEYFKIRVKSIKSVFHQSQKSKK